MPDAPKRSARPLAALHVVALSVAIGAPVAFATAVAPIALRVLPTRELAGAVNGAVLVAICRLLEGAFAVLLVTTWLLTASRRSRVAVVLRRLPVLAFFSAMVIERLVVPAMERVRNAESTGTIAFRRLHATSVWLLVLDLACGLALIAVVIRPGGETRRDDVAFRVS